MKVIIAGGGTGGHLFPAVALGEELVRERPAPKCCTSAPRYGFEAKWLPQSGFATSCPMCTDCAATGAMARLIARSANSSRAIGRARAVLRRFGADLVVSAGGYASAPMALAAILSRTPLVLMEQNTCPGLPTGCCGDSPQDLRRFRRDGRALQPAPKWWSPGIRCASSSARADRKPLGQSTSNPCFRRIDRSASPQYRGTEAFKIWKKVL